MTVPLLEALEQTVQVYSNAVLDDHTSLLLDIHGVHALGVEWAADSCERCTMDEDTWVDLEANLRVEKLYNLGPKHVDTLLHRLAREVMSFCMEIDQTTMEQPSDMPSSWEELHSKGWRVWSDDRLRQFRGDTDLCSRFFPLAVWLRQGDEVHVEGLADRYKKRAIELAEPGRSRNGYSSRLLSVELENLARRLAVPGPAKGKSKGGHDDLWYRLARYGPLANSDADKLAEVLLFYVRPASPVPPPYAASSENNNKTTSSSSARNKFPTWKQLNEMRYPFIDEDKYLDRGILLFRIHNIRQAIGSLCDEITTDVVVPFRDEFIPSARDLLRGMRAMSTLLRSPHNTAVWTGLSTEAERESVSAFVGRVDSVLDSAEASLKNIDAVLHLPWERDCARALDGLAAAEKQLAAVGWTIQAAKAAGWYLVNDTTTTTAIDSSSSSSPGRGRHFSLVRVFLPSRREIVWAAWSASMRLSEAIWNGGHRSLGHWLGGTDVFDPVLNHSHP